MTDGPATLPGRLDLRKWTPIGAFIATLIFGFGQAIVRCHSSIHLSRIAEHDAYLLTLVVLAAGSPPQQPARRDGIPYVPGAE